MDRGLLFFGGVVAFIALDLLSRYLRYRATPRAWTGGTAIIGALAWLIALLFGAHAWIGLTPLTLLSALAVSLAYLGAVLLIGRAVRRRS
ncbi:hypothetical protein [Kallotenue papyrolyticum]|uniref:hypothetical protein n=1 Tax=Kallotenue papyrolyticum TaxID=1325125 RepID=UPI0004785BD4|nr:hypothetical protein [Kallotenue papyrolyticum]